MPKFRIDVAMDVRAYGYVKVEAEDLDAALAKVDQNLIDKAFQLNGAGLDDFDLANSTNHYVWYEDADGNFAEKELY